MKKMILTLAIAFTALSSFATEEKVTPKVLNAFQNEFNTAKEVEWTVANTYYMATFTYNNKYVFAYYTADGNLIGLTHYISSAELPMSLQNKLKKEYSGFWISDLFEVAKNGRTEYYVTLENAGKKMVLQSSDSNSWEEYRTVKKV